MFHAIIDDIKEYFSILFKKDGRYLLIMGILSIIFSVIELLVFSMISPSFNVILFIVYALVLYYGYKFLTMLLQKLLIKLKIIQYLPDDYTFNSEDERIKNNLQYKMAIDHYSAIKSYVIMFSIAFFIFLSILTTYNILARLVFVLIAGLVMYFLTIEPVEYSSGSNKQPTIMDKVKDGLGMGDNKAGENLASITNVIDNFKQSELNKPAPQEVPVEPMPVQPTMGPTNIPKEEPINMNMTEEFYGKKE